MSSLPSLSTDQVAAFVELARQGTLRKAAESLFITEQGLRNRLLSLEERLGIELYRKSRGIRRGSPLTAQGQQFLPEALAFLDRARELVEMFQQSAGHRVVHVAASQYLILYVMIDAVRRFHDRNPQIRVRLSDRIEQEIETGLLEDPEIDFGVAAPYEPPTGLHYQNLFSMSWSLIAPPKHPLLKRAKLTLVDLCDVPLILFERGSTGRQHIVDGFHAAGLSPRVDMEATTTEIIVRMVEAGLGVSIVPLLPNGAVTRGRKLGITSLSEQIRPIHSGILTRRGEALSPPAREFVDFLVQETLRFGQTPAKT